MAKKKTAAPEQRGRASKPISFKPLSPKAAMDALLSVRPEDLDEALKEEDERRDR